MRYLKQFTIILTISLLGEVLHYFIPLPVPASIYGLLLMLAACGVQKGELNDCCMAAPVSQSTIT